MHRFPAGSYVFIALDFSAMKETQPDELFAAWIYLPDGQRNTMDAEFRDIFEPSCEKGFRAIIDEAAWHLATEPDARTAFVERLNRSVWYRTLRPLDYALARWACRKFKKLKHHIRQARSWIARVSWRESKLFAHW